MPNITTSQAKEIETYIKVFEGDFKSSFLSVLGDKIRLFQYTEEILNVSKSLTELDEALNKPAGLGAYIELPANVLPCLKRVLLSIRRSEATNYDRAKQTTIHPELIDKLEAKVRPFDELINQKWLQEVEPMRMPRYAEYLPVQQIEEHYHTTRENSGREYDEKFHILQAQRQFLPDLDNWRWKCELRGGSIVVAHVDIDNFKQFNSKYGHIEVDRQILPTFMRLLESHVFSHGYAYRYGGDEYALLLPNIDYDLAVKFLDLLRKKIESLQYQGIKEKTTVSIGFCYLDSDSYLTDREAEERANKAMRFAKQSDGKNCVAGFVKSRYDDESLRVVSSS